MQKRRSLLFLSIFHDSKRIKSQFSPSFHYFASFGTLTSDSEGAVDYDPSSLYSDIPKPRRCKSERKPYPTPMKVLIRRAKEEREARKARPCQLLQDAPDNGLLVPELVDVAHRVYRARESLLFGLSKLVGAIPIQRCRYCFEVHIGHVGHEIRTCTGPKSGLRSAMHMWRRGGIEDIVYFPKSYHLYDRVGKPRVGHNDRRTVRRIPAIVELCIQAGLDLKKYPTRRRTKPVYSIEGRIVDFESLTGNNEKKDENKSYVGPIDTKAVLESESVTEDESLGSGRALDHVISPPLHYLEGKSLGDISTMTLESWFEMISGAKKIMEKYKVHTCGYCPEVQVGPKGHKVRMCKASKHQSRNGLHAWQEATIDDLVGPNYVWHVSDSCGPPLANNLKRYYGKAPAVVELCVQAGAPTPDLYMSMMRLDVVPPSRDELDLVT